MGVPYYLPNEQEASDVLQHHFPGWTVKSFQNLNSESEDYLTFAHIVRGSTHVLALRRTASAMDTLQDLTFWMPAVLTDLAFKLGPHFVGTRRIAKVLKGIVGDTFKHSYEPLLNYAQEVMGDHPGEKNLRHRSLARRRDRHDRRRLPARPSHHLLRARSLRHFNDAGSSTEARGSPDVYREH